jgi:hypothetical protein
MDGRGGGRIDFGRGAIKDPAKREQGIAFIRDTVKQAVGAGA